MTHVNSSTLMHNRFSTTGAKRDCLDGQSLVPIAAVDWNLLLHLVYQTCTARRILALRVLRFQP